MAQVNSSDVFPSIRTISTDSVGDLQEVTSVPAIKAKKEISSDISLEAVEFGAVGNGISVEVVENFGGSANSIDVQEVLDSSNVVVAVSYTHLRAHET